MSMSRFVGIRYAGHDNQYSLVGFISRLARRGLTLSVVVLLVVLSVINGFERELRDKILALVPHVELSRHGGIADYEAVASQLETSADVLHAFPYLQLQGLAKFHRVSAPLIISAIDIGEEAEFYGLDKFLIEGRLELEVSEIALGSSIAEELGVNVGDRLMYIVPGQGDKLPSFNPLRVGAILHTGTELDAGLALTNLNTGFDIARVQRPSGIKVVLQDLFRADYIAIGLANDLGPAYVHSTWTRKYANLYFAIETSKQMIMLLLVLIIAIATFNVVSTLIMAVIEKRADIAIFRTMGASQFKVVSIFVWQGAAIGMKSSVAGLLIGGVITLSLPIAIEWLEALSGLKLLDTAVYPVDFVPVELKISDMVSLFVVTVTVSAIASLFPALSTTKIEPAKALQQD